MASAMLLVLVALNAGAADGGPVIPVDAGATPSVETAHDTYAQPPSLSAVALCDELRQGAQSRKSERTHLDEQRRELAAERARLEKLAQEIETSRQALRAETAQLEDLLKRVPPKGATAAAGDPASPPTGTSPAVEKGRVESLAKTLKGMKPEQAAAVIAHLEPALSAALLHQLRPADAGAVLDHLKPEQAAELMAAMARPGGKP